MIENLKSIALLVCLFTCLTRPSKGDDSWTATEHNCTGSVTTEFQCGNGRCIDSLRKCDLQDDCADGSDEKICNSAFCDPDTKYQCAQGECIDIDMVCDSSYDCPDKDDESHCGVQETCPSDRFRCDNGHCIPLGYRCNGERECGDGSDENNCTKRGRECSKDQFTCSNLRCIPRSFLCDGEKDCSDGVDELNCRSLSDCPSVHGHFPCLDLSKCIAGSHVCDGVKDCTDGSDEGPECAKNCSTTVCQMDCMKTPSGPQCLCNIGFKLAKNNKTCEDINECEGPSLFCDHFCTNKPGTAICTCAEGYKLLSDKASCRIEEPAILLFSVGPKVVAKLLDHTQSWNVYEGEDDAYGVAYDPIEDKVYWIVGEKILSKKLTGSENPDLFVDQGFKRPENLAIDWLGRNVYIADGDSNQIIACSIDSIHCVPILRNLSHPRGIQLDLLNRHIYWSDVGSHKIQRADLDGANVVSLIRHDLVWPNGLALDFPASRLYWADAKLDHVKTSDLNGKDHRSLPDSEMGHVFSLAVWQDRLYWTDWIESHNKEIHSCRKRDCKFRSIEYKDESHEISNLMVHHPSMFVNTKNPCKHPIGKGCTHLCFLSKSSKNGFICGCPEEMILSSNGLTCHDVEKKKLKLLVAVESKLYHYDMRKYGVNTLMPLRIKDFQLGSASDMTYNPVKNTAFICDSQKRILFELNLNHNTIKKVVDKINKPIGVAVDWIRDNVYWISGYHNSVEVIRSNGQFRKTIINHLKRPTSIALDIVEGYLFVSDSSTLPTIVRCELDGSGCLIIVESLISNPISIYLDTMVSPKRLYWADLKLGKIDSVLVDGSDRRNELHNLFSPMKVVVNKFIMWTESRSPMLFLALKSNTSDTKQLHLDVVKTDGMDAHFGGEWMMNLVMVGGDLGTPGEKNPCFGDKSCHHLCFSKDQIQKCECANGLVLDKDNTTCSKGKCALDELKCANGECISKHFWCDNSADCDDGSDEVDCFHLRNCSDKEFQCKNGHCRWIDDVCDGYDDCSDKSDEDPVMCANVTRNCPNADKDWKCNSGECIPRNWRCDLRPHCKDGSDEKNCDDVICPDSHMRCNNGWCISLDWVCDGAEDCSDGKDEKDCSCKLGEYKCQNGSCLNELKLCMGEQSCGDKEPLKINCSEFESVYRVVGRVTESGAEKAVCPINWRPCSNDEGVKNIECKPHAAWCNGTKECSGGEDEQNCSLCSENFVKCKGSFKCIPAEWRCDGAKDCDGGSDEEGCQPTEVTTTEKPTCEPDEFECSSGVCILQSKVCDGNKDCLYGVDESENCNKCEFDNGGCEQICSNDPLRVICSCRKGFKLQSDGVSCSDINECENEDICHHNCINMKGTFQCTCNEGYSLKEDKITCKLTVGQPWSIIIVNNEALSYLDDNLNIHLKVPMNKSFEFVDPKFIYNPVNQSLLATNGKKGEVYNIKEGKLSMIFSNFSEITAADFDNVNENLYVAEANVHTRQRRDFKRILITSVKVCSLRNIMCGALIDGLVNVEISSIKVSPILGMMFTCENLENENSGRIMSRKLDSSSKYPLAENKVLKCGSIAVDEVKKRVYWFDTILNRIESVDVLGKGRLNYETNEVDKATSLTIINHSLLWFNTDTRMIVMCLIQNPKQCTEIYHGSEVAIVDLKQSYAKSVSTPCPSPSCPHICVPSNFDVPHCTCALGYKYHNDSCELISSASANRALRGSCADLHCVTGTCHTDSLGFVFCSCPPTSRGKYCEISIQDKSSKGHGGAIAIAVISLIIIFGLVAFLIFYKRKSLKFITESPYVRFKFSKQSFGRMREESLSQPPTPIVSRSNLIKIAEPNFQAGPMDATDSIIAKAKSTSAQSVDCESLLSLGTPQATSSKDPWGFNQNCP